MIKPRNIIIALAAFLVVAASIWTAAQRKSPARPLFHAISKPSPLATPAPTTSATKFLASMRQQPGGPYQPTDPRWEERRRLRREDPQYEWKTPIEFYGKVLDQNEQPVPGVEVSMNWTDMSPNGTSAATVTTDAEGRFSITGIQGKNFGVRSLKKDGYLEAVKSNPRSFEYAGFWKPTYHEPDPNKPVIFHLRKKGDPAPLLFSEGKFVVTFGTQSQIPMPKVARAGVVSPVKVTVFENDVKTRRWKARIWMEEGGIQPALEEFPFTAPLEGYHASIDLDQKSPRPPGWQDLDEGGCFISKRPRDMGCSSLARCEEKGRCIIRSC
jgi:hypothetical protein